jgi:hypothetical protein
VWGSLGSITLALLQQWGSKHCCVSLATQQLRRRAYQKPAWLRTQQWTGVSMVMRFVVFGVGLICTAVCVGIRSSEDVFWNRVSRVVLVCRAMDFFWLEDWVRIGKLWEKHVSLYHGWWRQSIVGANDRLMMDYTPKCRCGVQVDR